MQYRVAGWSAIYCHSSLYRSQTPYTTFFTFTAFTVLSLMSYIRVAIFLFLNGSAPLKAVKRFRGCSSVSETGCSSTSVVVMFYRIKPFDVISFELVIKIGSVKPFWMVDEVKRSLDLHHFVAVSSSQHSLSSAYSVLCARGRTLRCEHQSGYPSLAQCFCTS